MSCSTFRTLYSDWPWRFREPPIEIDVTREGAIEHLMLSKGIERGELFRRLETLAPLPDPDRRLGSMELRGAYRGLTVVLSFDDWIFSPMGTSWIPGNRIAFQVRRSKIEQSGASAWVEECISLCCMTVDPLFGFACVTEEYTAKNIQSLCGRDTRKPETRAPHDSLTASFVMSSLPPRIPAGKPGDSDLRPSLYSANINKTFSDVLSEIYRAA